jgi:hypothetical protein
MEALYARIKTLPQVLQDIIAEYNVEHRTHVKQLKDEFFSMIYRPCRFCKEIPSYEFWSTDYFIFKKYSLSVNWCHQSCFDRDHAEEEKTRYLESIDDFLANHSIQYGKKSLEY